VNFGGNTTKYTYDSQNQLIREDNQAGGYTYFWTYDNAGNILSRKEYAYTTGTLGTPIDTVNYTYGNANWGDLLTKYDGQTITYDTIGNPLTYYNGSSWSFTWKHGRELATMTKNGVTWTNTYGASGMRTRRTDGSTTYKYFYNGSTLSQMTVGSNTLDFLYEAEGRPLAVVYNGTYYYYITNLQGDVVALLNTSGETVVSYTYDAWGKLRTISGALTYTLGALNPLRYRGYVYDNETGFYYLQSRYYDPTIGRFLNADAFASTGQGLLGNNMFAYCNNNPVMYSDPSGEILIEALIFIGAAVLVGAGTGAFIAASNGGDAGDILEGAIEGALTGGIAAALGFFTAPFGATGAVLAAMGGLAFGVFIDAGVQFGSYTIRNKTVEGFVFDERRLVETGITTALSAAVPTFNGVQKDISWAIGSAIVGMDASALIAVITVIVDKVFP